MALLYLPAIPLKQIYSERIIAWSKIILKQLKPRRKNQNYFLQSTKHEGRVVISDWSSTDGSKFTERSITVVYSGQIVPPKKRSVFQRGLTSWKLRLSYIYPYKLRKKRSNFQLFGSYSEKRKGESGKNRQEKFMGVNSCVNGTVPQGCSNWMMQINQSTATSWQK